MPWVDIVDARIAEGKPPTAELFSYYRERDLCNAAKPIPFPIPANPTYHNTIVEGGAVVDSLTVFIPEDVPDGWVLAVPVRVKYEAISGTSIGGNAEVWAELGSSVGNRVQNSNTVAIEGVSLVAIDPSMRGTEQTLNLRAAAPDNVDADPPTLDKYRASASWGSKTGQALGSIRRR